MSHRSVPSRSTPRRAARRVRALSLLVALAVGSRTAAAQRPFEIRIAPGDYLIPHEARAVGVGYEGTSPYYELIVQAILVVNRSGEPITIDAAGIAVKRAGASLQQTAIAAAEFERTQETATVFLKNGLTAGMEAYYSAGRLIPAGVSIAPTRTLAPGTAALVDDNYLVVRALPDTITITVQGRTAAGREVTGAASFPVRRHESKNAYIFPVEPGSWFILAYPGIKGHHWWTTATEHGIDITMVDAHGSWAKGALTAWPEGTVARWEDWYAYGKKVLAAADGIVVKVTKDEEFPLSFWNRRAGESSDAYHERIGEHQMKRFAAPGADPMAVASGNHVVIRHANGEYTLYAHLAFGSVRVQEGERVKQGDHIAGVGGTGEEPAVHLHFQVIDGPSPAVARTFPVEFTNVRVNEHGADRFAPKMVFQSGYFVTVGRPVQ